MSVINKMLRDLDRRQADGATPVQIWESRTGMTRDTSKRDHSVRDDSNQNSTSSAVLIAVLLTALVFSAAAGAWWYLTQNQSMSRPLDQAKQVPIAPVPVPVPVAPVAVAPVAPVPVAPVVIVPVPAMPTKIVPQSPIQTTTPELPAVVAKLPKIESVVRTDTPLKIDRPVTMAPKPNATSNPAVTAPPRPVVERPVNGTPTVAVASAEAPTNPLRPSPAMEALAQAQNLWSTGAHQEAVELAREALGTAERTNLASPSAGNKSVLASLARELARMEMAQGRVRQALEMLTRLEPTLFTNADVWAMRGNAAQRLGRHGESVAAYLMALKFRPSEARWMLAAAISYANQGQMTDAAELTEKARAGGVLTPEVVAYLKQLGVPMRER